jgi:predicted RNase H-related nuclease YkuK (DUF458 family)
MELNINFRKLGDHSLIPSLAAYAQEQVKLHPDTKIYVGSDSQTTGSMTNLATVIVFHYGNNGAHVVYRTIKMKRIDDNFSRLWLEVTSSIEIAQYLKEDLGLKVTFVDLDLNEDDQYKSNAVLRSAVGFVTGSGFEPRWKPHDAFAVRVADTLCR